MSLRSVVLLVFGALFAFFVVQYAAGSHEARGLIAPAIALGLLCLSFFVERPRYEGTTPSPDARATGEVFRDPVSGAITDVVIDEATGVRSYRTRAS